MSKSSLLIILPMLNMGTTRLEGGNVAIAFFKLGRILCIQTWAGIVFNLLGGVKKHSLSSVPLQPFRLKRLGSAQVRDQKMGLTKDV